MHGGSDMELTMTMMQYNVNQASSLLSLTTPVAQRISQPESEPEEQVAENVDASLPTYDLLNHPLLTTGVASLSLTFAPSLVTSKSLHPSSAASSASSSVLNMASKDSKARKLSQVHCHAPTPVISSMAVIKQASTVASVPSTLPLALPTSNTSFPDMLRLPGKNGYSIPRSVGGMRKSSIVWFRNDLRVHDNEALTMAHNESLSVLPLYCFDPRDYGKSSSGFDKTGPFRAKFLLESLADLRNSLRALGSDLVVRVGHPEKIIPQLARAVGAQALFCHQEVTREEISIENTVTAALQEEGVDIQKLWGSTLYHLDDLPFSSLEAMPANYAGFKEQTCNVQVRDTLETPARLKALPGRGSVEAGKIPSLQDLGLNPAVKTNLAANRGPCLLGGETEALKRLSSFMAESQGRSGARDTIVGASFSCKISPWLAMGCISPRRMYQDLKASSPASTQCISNEGASASASQAGLSWLIFELLWRDFFRFITKKYSSSQKEALVAA